MAHKVTDYWHSFSTTRAVLLLGEDHMGAWSHTDDTEDALDAVVDWHDAKAGSRLVLWYEGEEPSPSFQKFTAWFKGTYTNSFTTKSWDPPSSSMSFTREEGLVMDAMGGDADAFVEQLGLGKPLIDQLMHTHDWQGADPSARYGREEILRTFRKGLHGKRYEELLLAPITHEGLNEWFTLRDEAFTDPRSGLYPLMTAPQRARQDALSKLLKSKNGIYLCGESHIGEMRSRGLLR